MNQGTRIATEIQKLIHRDGIPPGGRLPTEHALARRFRVSRPIVREALQQLKILGVVESSPRVGLRVLPFDPAALFDHAIPRIRTDEERGELHEFRRVLEPAVLRLVHRRAPKAKLQELEKMLRIPLPRGRRAIHEFFARDVAFHEGLWKLAGNRFLWSLRGLLVRYFADIERHPGGRVTDAVMRKANAEHLVIVRALLDDDLDRAEQALERNLGTFRPGKKKKRP